MLSKVHAATETDFGDRLRSDFSGASCSLLHRHLVFSIQPHFLPSHNKLNTDCPEKNSFSESNESNIDENTEINKQAEKASAFQLSLFDPTWTRTWNVAVVEVVKMLTLPH
jgi:hypothetical protein